MQSFILSVFYFSVVNIQLIIRIQIILQVFLKNNRIVKKMSTLNHRFHQRGETMSNPSALLPTEVLFYFKGVCSLHSLKILFMHILHFIQQELLKCGFVRQLQHIGGDNSFLIISLLPIFFLNLALHPILGSPIFAYFSLKFGWSVYKNSLFFDFFHV